MALQLPIEIDATRAPQRDITHKTPQPINADPIFRGPHSHAGPPVRFEPDRTNSAAKTHRAVRTTVRTRLVQQVLTFDDGGPLTPDLVIACSGG
jgi:hypothetical protein